MGYGGTMPGNTMRTVHFYAYGGHEKLVVEQVPRPEPQAGEVLVRVHAAGVNPIDWKIRKGLFKDVRPVPLPFTPGSELAGTVELLGSGVTAFEIGQAVYGRGAQGAYADYAVISANSLAPKPQNITFDHPPSFPIAPPTTSFPLFTLPVLQA